MQRNQHQRLSTLFAGKQLWNEHASLSIRYWYVPLTKGFMAIGNVSNSDTIRPWFKRYEA